MKQRYGCRHFEFTDEALPPRTLEHLADALRPYEHENLRFVGYARAKLSTPRGTFQTGPSQLVRRVPLRALTT